MPTEGLKDELMTDPLARGYGAMTDVEVLTDLHIAYRTRSRSVIPAGDLLAALEDADLTALDATAHQKLLLFMSVGKIDISNERVQDAMEAIFTGRTGALSRLRDLQNEPITRAQELQLGVLRLGHVQVARA